MRADDPADEPILADCVFALKSIIFGYVIGIAFYTVRNGWLGNASAYALDGEETFRI